MTDREKDNTYTMSKYLLFLFLFFFHAFFFFFSSLGVELSFFCFFPFFWGRRILFFLFLACFSFFFLGVTFFFSCFWLLFLVSFFLGALCFLSLLPSPEQAVRNSFLRLLIVSLIHVDPVRNHAMNDMFWPPVPNNLHVTYPWYGYVK